MLWTVKATYPPDEWHAVQFDPDVYSVAEAVVGCQNSLMLGLRNPFTFDARQIQWSAATEAVDE